MMTQRYGLILLALLVCCGCGQASEELPAPPDQSLVTNEAGVGGDGRGFTREQTFIASLTIFVLAIFVGFEVITKVPPTLHTPLMSGSNAISGITLVGAALMTGSVSNSWTIFFGLIAVIMATINVIGGFMVTDRMLAMFKKR